MGLSGITIKIVKESENNDGEFKMYDKTVYNADDFIPMLSTEEYPKENAKYQWTNFLPFEQAPAHRMLYKGAYDYPDFKMMVGAYHTRSDGKCLFASELDNWLVLETTLRSAFIKLCDKFNWWQDVRRYKIVKGDIVHWVWYFEYSKDSLRFCYFLGLSNGYKSLRVGNSKCNYQSPLSKYYRDKYTNLFNESLDYNRGYWENITTWNL